MFYCAPATAQDVVSAQGYSQTLAACAPLAEKGTKPVSRKGSIAVAYIKGCKLETDSRVLRENRGRRLDWEVREGCSEEETLNLRTEGLTCRYRQQHGCRPRDGEGPGVRAAGRRPVWPPNRNCGQAMPDEAGDVGGASCNGLAPWQPGMVGRFGLRGPADWGWGPLPSCANIGQCDRSRPQCSYTYHGNDNGTYLTVVGIK